MSTPAQWFSYLTAGFKTFEHIWTCWSDTDSKIKRSTIAERFAFIMLSENRDYKLLLHFISAFIMLSVYRDYKLLLYFISAFIMLSGYRDYKLLLHFISAFIMLSGYRDALGGNCASKLKSRWGNRIYDTSETALCQVILLRTSEVKVHPHFDPK